MLMMVIMMAVWPGRWCTGVYVHTDQRRGWKDIWRRWPEPVCNAADGRTPRVALHRSSSEAWSLPACHLCQGGVTQLLECSFTFSDLMLVMVIDVYWRH